MFNYNQMIQSQQRQSEIARKVNASEPEGWTHPVPNLFDKLFAALKPAKKAQTPAQKRASSTKTLPAK
jgi:hypothetical protein